MKPLSLLLWIVAASASLSASGLPAVAASKTTASTATGSAPSCEALARHPDEPGSNGRGVADADLDTLAGNRQCRLDIANDLYNVPARYRFARTYWVEGPVQDFGVFKGALGGCVSIAGAAKKLQSMPAEEADWYLAQCLRMQDEGYLQTLAEAGDLRAQMYLVENDGRGGIPDEGRWIRAAAEKDYTYAIWFMGYIEQLRQNYTEAARWYEIAARRGLAVSQTTLSALYRNGLGVEANPEKAEALLLMAAANGNWEAIEYIKDREEARNAPPPQSLDDYLVLLGVIGLLAVIDSGDGGSAEPSPPIDDAPGWGCSNWGEWDVGGVCVPDPSLW